MTQARAAAPDVIARIADRFFQTRWLVRMPIGLYRAGSPGRVRDHRRFAGKAQWYRNITANPRVRVSTGFSRKMAALAEPMPSAESAAVLHNFIEHHPAEWKKMQGIFEHVCGRPVDTKPMVRLRVQPRQ